MSDDIKLAMEQFDESDQLTRHWRDAAEDDIRFTMGEQWPRARKEDRDNNGLPCLTIDRLEGPISKIVGDQRQNDLAARVIPRGRAGSMVDTDGKEVDEAEFVSGMIREIQRKCRFEWTQATAFEHAVVCGMGGWYVCTAYVSHESFDQRLMINPVDNPLSIYPDIRGWGTDGGMSYCLIVDTVSRAQFESQWPGARGDFERGPWAQADGVRVATWWQVTHTNDELLEVRTPDGQRATVLASAAGGMPAGSAVLRTRKVRVPRVKVSRITQSEELESTDWPGLQIPVALVLGRRLWVDGRLELHGLVRKAKDAQRMYNYYRSATAEAMGIAPRAPYMVTPQQVRGHENMWQEANKGIHPYLYVNPDPQAPGWPMRQQIAYPAGFAQEAVIAANDIMSVTKIHEASLGQRSNETSGLAIQMRQREGDVGNYLFTDNLLMAVEHTGRCMVEALPHVYDGTRLVQSRGPDGKGRGVVLNQPSMGGYRNTLGTYDLEVISGPAFGTARQEAVQAMTTLFQAAPQLAAIGADIWIANQDWPGAQDMADRLRKMLPPELKEQTDQDPARLRVALQQAAQQMQVQQQQMEQLQEQARQFAEQARASEMKAEDMERRAQVAKEQLALTKQAAQVEIDKAKAILAIRTEADARRVEIEPAMQTLAELQKHVPAVELVDNATIDDGSQE